MKNLLLFLFIFFNLIAFGQRENFGTPSANTLITDYTGWSNTTVVYSGTGDVRVSSASSGYAGASGSGNVFLTTGGTKTLIISGITLNTGATSGTLGFGVLKSTTSSNGSELTISYTNATGSSSITLPTGSGTAIWAYRTIPLTFTGGDITITFTNTSASAVQFRLDDISISNTVLPVELKSFNVSQVQEGNKIEWQTASETNVSHFDIQRSVDAQKWESIGEVKAASNSREEKNYSFTDENPLPISYYRLRSVDFDGAEQFSQVVRVERAGSNKAPYVLPTNVENETTVIFESEIERETTIVIFDMNGKQLFTQAVSVEKGENRLPLNLSNLPQGAYTLRVMDGQSAPARFVKI